MGKGETLLNAVIGAVVTVLLSFTGVSPVLGGAVAGYLQEESRERGAMVGAISGVVAAVPVVIFAFLFFGFFLVGGVPGVTELFFVALIGIPLVLLWNGLLGAAGGYLGTYLWEDDVL